MATTASNAPAAFGALQTPSFPQHSPYMTDGLVKTEYDPADDHPIAFPSSPLNVVAVNNAFDSDIVNQTEEIAPAPAPPQSSIDEMMGNLRRRSESTSIYHADMDLYSEAMSTHMAESVKADLESYAAEEPAAVEPQPMQAYAKLQFDDGDFYVNTYAVELGRDQEAMKRERRHKKRAKKRQVIQEEETRKALPFGDDTPVQAAAIMRATAGSNVSESGGIIGVSVFSDSEDEHKNIRRRKRRGLTSQDSSHSQSIAPVNILHNPESIGLGDDIFAEDSQSLAPPPMDCPFIPIYRSTDGVKGNGISRKHVRIEYNSEKAHWELHALGKNGAFIDGALVKQGESVKLDHQSHIQIQQISITFKLPDVAIADEEVAVESYESDNDAEKLGSSPETRLADRRGSGSLSELEEEVPRERVKLKLSLSKRGQSLDKKTAKAAKISLKANKTKEAVTESPVVEEPELIEEMEVRPSVEENVSESKLPKPESNAIPATPAANLAPGSVLEGLAPEEIPQKRKGPGRPPKNGVMSKRDEAIIKRKKKELQKAGLEVPPLAELLAMARAESGTTTKKPNEEDGDGTGVNGTPGEASAGVGEGSSKPQTQAEMEAAKARKMAAKSPSPQKPETEYTEEELKKPQKTYVVLIHDALCNSTTGIMDLQQIYDAIQKMYPYYKYRSQTMGWQSSIRHNLIGSDAFEEAGKIGKGRLWKINPNFDIGKEKKRRAQTPPTSENRPPHMYQQHQQAQYNNNPNAPPQQQQQQRYSQYGPSPYGTPYGPPTNALPNGARPPPSYAQQRNGNYYSPYAAQPQNGQATQSPYAAQGRPPHTQAPSSQSPATGTPQPPGQQRPNASLLPPGPPGSHQTPPVGAPPPAGQPRPPQQQEGIGNNDTIEEIMSYHKKYLGQFRQGPEQDAARDLFRKAVSRHIDQNKVHGAYISEEEKKVADVIGEIITRNKNKPRPAVPQQTSPAQTQVPQQRPTNPPAQLPVNGQVPQPLAGTAQPPHAQSVPHPQIYQPPSTHSPAPPAQMSAPPGTIPAAQPSATASTTIDLTDSANEARPAGQGTMPTPAQVGTSSAPTGNAAQPPPPSTPVAPFPAGQAPIATTNGKRSADEATDEPDAKRLKE